MLVERGETPLALGQRPVIARATVPITHAVPVLRVADVARSMAWYQQVLGFRGDPFPAQPPHTFALLRHGPVELMLRHDPPAPRPRRPYNWDVYLRLKDTPFREVFARLAAAGVTTRRLERMPYGLAEFEITDPDGHVLCLSQEAGMEADLPTPQA